VSCACLEPIEAADPRHTACLRCGQRIDPDILSTDTTLTRFFDRLQQGGFPGKPSESFRVFRAESEGREKRGRRLFGLKYLRKENCQEACEEAADIGIYMHLDVLCHARKHDSEEDIDLALTAAWHAFKAHEAARLLASKRRGGP
jgi:hypothetical protein